MRNTTAVPWKGKYEEWLSPILLMGSI